MTSHALTVRILIGITIGTITGVVLNLVGPSGWVKALLIDGALHVGATIFLSSLKLLVVPLVLISLTCGTAGLNDLRSLGRVGGRTLTLYLITTCAAVSLALAFGALIQPGAGFELTTDATFQPKPAPPLVELLTGIIPTNPFQALTEGNMLQVIVFACFLGFTLKLVGKPGERLLGMFNDFNAVIMKMVTLLMLLAPIGVFCLITKVFALQGFAAVVPLSKYFATVLLVLVVHGALIYPTLLRLLSGLNPLTFFRKIREMMVVAFSTSSSNATIPVTIETVEHKLGVSNSIASFTIPLGATINMDGTAIMQGVATAFIAQAYGIHIGLEGYLMVVLTATLASIGTAGVPGVGLITLAMVLKQVGLPVEGIGIIIGVDRILDMARTVVNVTGDAVVTCIVAKVEGQLSEKTFNA